MYLQNKKKIEENNLDYCSLCGLCKTNCPVFKVELKESSSSRAKAIALKSRKIDFSMYKCSLCGLCLVECPANVKIDILSARSELVRDKKELGENIEMIKNIKKFGNPYGDPKKTYKPKY